MEKYIEGVLKMTKFKLNDINFKLNEKGKGYIWIKYNGDFLKVDKLGINKEQVQSFIEKILKERDLSYEDFEQKKDLDLSYEILIDEKIYYFRVNLFFARGKPGIIMRFIQTKIPDLDEDIKIPREYLEPLLKAKERLFVIAGSTGSGKTTTIAGIINEFSRTRKEHILSLEDPIEYRFDDNLSGLNQREVGRDTNSYANGLKASLRQMPDIIFLGELRTFETIDLALKLSESGHLVISTIHTKDAASVIGRILNTVPDSRLKEVRATLANAFGGAIYQELLKTKDGGRVVAIETMYNNSNIGNVIINNELGKLRSIIETNRDLGMITKKAYIEKEIIPKQIVDGKEMQKHLNS